VLHAGRESPFPWMTVLLAAITIVGLAFRLPSFNDALFGDEVSTNYVVNGFGIDSILHIVISDQEGTPPLFFWLTWLSKGFDGVEGLRVVSLAAGLASIPLTYMLGVRTVSQPAGMVGAALIALSPFQIYYATEARAYALVMLFCLLAALTLLMAVETGRARWWVAYALSMAAAAYTHYTVAFVLLGLFGWAFIARPESRKPLLLSGVGVVLLYVPWIPELLDDRNEPAAHVIDVLLPLTVHNAANELVHWSLGHPYNRIADLPGDLAIWLVGAAAALGVVGLIFGRSRGGPSSRRMPSAGLALVLVMALAAPVGVAVASLLGPDIFVSRNVIGSTPGLALVVGVLVTAGGAPWRYAAVALLLGGVAIGSVKMLDAENQRPDYAAFRTYIEAAGRPDSPVVEGGASRLTPGPQTMLEAALAPKGQAAPDRRKLLTLGIPTLEARLDLRREGKNVLSTLPVPSGAEVAREAARAAGSGEIFLVTSDAPLELVRELDARIAVFLDALPPRFHEVESRSFPGLGAFGFAVHVLSGG
jgi:Dolichyl-phosphate-mannose-protein mannosyltransferase